MDIRYFYVTDHIQNKTLSLRHCPTEEMLADYFTKPLQGSLFIRLRNHIMGADFDAGDRQNQRSVLDYHDEQDENISGPVDQDQNHENVLLRVRRKISTSQKLAVGVKTTTTILAKILAKTMVKTDLPNEPMKNKEQNLNQPMKNQENKHQ